MALSWRRPPGALKKEKIEPSKLPQNAATNPRTLQPLREGNAAAPHPVTSSTAYISPGAFHPILNIYHSLETAGLTA